MNSQSVKEFVLDAIFIIACAALGLVLAVTLLILFVYLIITFHWFGVNLDSLT